MRKATLRADAIFLAVAGVFGLTSDLLSYVSGGGPFGAMFYQNPTVIGVVEAHALAILTAATLWYYSQSPFGAFGNWVGLSAHLVLGGSNVIWFEVFRRTQAEPQGVAVTLVHFLFAGLNALLIIRSGASRLEA